MPLITRLDGPCPECLGAPCLCGEAYLMWPIERIERLRSVLTSVLLLRKGTPVTYQRIFRVNEDDQGGL